MGRVNLAMIDGIRTRDMLLRIAVLEDDLLSWGGNGIGCQPVRASYYGELVYNQGYAMLLYIEDQYGQIRWTR